MVLDVIDEKIIQMLRTDGRISLTDISMQIGLSSPSIRDRIKKLEETGIIRGYSVILDEKKLGYNVVAFLGVILDHPQCCREDVVEAIVKMPEVIEAHYTDGDEDMLVKVICRGTEELLKLLAAITSIPGVVKTRTVMSLSTLFKK